LGRRSGTTVTVRESSSKDISSCGISALTDSVSVDQSSESHLLITARDEKHSRLDAKSIVVDTP
jgi:hypothetical protein